jgi:serine/threonine protein kinase/Tfp pilus assembly protein PilF
VAIKCPKCQAENPDTLNFCGGCGTQLPHSRDIHPKVTETLQTPIHELTSGSTFAGRYQVIEELGHGGMGRVYKVLDTDIKEKIALKLLRPEIALDKETVDRFSNELKLARKISHRNVCRMFDLGKAEGTTFITMEFVPGEDLKKFIRKTGQLGAGRTVSIAKQVCEGLMEAHRLGVVHRDLKPQNIMVDEDGNARIMDFGIARSLRGKAITGAGVMIGTPEYMSPEQVEGKDVDQRSDLYSLGIILYEMLTGRVPFEGDTPFTIGVKHKSELPRDPRELNTQIPEELDRLVLKCLEKDRAKRYQSAEELHADLGKIEQGLPTTERVISKRKPFTSGEITVKFNLRKLALPLSAVIVLAAGAIVLWTVIPHKKVPAAPKIENSIAVISFENQTGDKGYNYLRKAIPHLLITSLEQKGGAYVATWERLRDILKQIGKGDQDQIDSDVGFELCRREGIQALVLGSFMKAGDMFALDVKVLDVETKKLLRSAGAKGKGVDSILESQIDELSGEIWQGVGLSAKGLEFAPTKVVNVTTASMEAYNYFLKADEEVNRLHWESSRQFLEKALELDPTFALAHSWLAFVLLDVGDVKASREEYELAKRYSVKATEKERLYIEADYARYVEHDPLAYSNLMEQLVRSYPKEKQFHLDLGVFLKDTDLPRAIGEFTKAAELDPQFGPALQELGLAYRGTGDYEKALGYYRRYIAVYPGEVAPLESIALTYLRMGDLEQAQAKFNEALEIDRGSYWSLKGMFYIAAVKQDYAEAKRWADHLLSPARAPLDRIEGYWCRGLLELWLGRFKGAMEALREAADLGDKISNKGAVVFTDYIKGCIHLERGEFELGRKCLQACWDYETGTYPLERSTRKMIYGYELVLCELGVGRTDPAKSRWTDIKGYLAKPGDATSWDMALMLDLLSVEIQLHDGPANVPVNLVERVKALKPPVIFSLVYLPAYNLLPFKDVVARAFRQNGEIDRAISEYERLTTIGPQNISRAMIPPLYYYHLARLYEQKGAAAKAAGNYRRFLDLWKDADPGLPEVEDARPRLAGLR